MSNVDMSEAFLVSVSPGICLEALRPRLAVDECVAGVLIVDSLPAL